LAGGLSADFPPTTQQKEVKTLLETQLAQTQHQLNDVLSKDLEAFNKMLRDRNIQNVIARAP